MRVRVFVSGLVIATTLAACEAHADDSVYSPPWPAAPFSSRPPPPERKWYGWQILSIDVALITTQYLVETYASHEVSFPTGFAVAGGYFVGPPLVHLAHDRPAAAAGSLALRAGAPLVLGATVQALASCDVKQASRDDAPRVDTSGCEDGAFVFGAVLGVVTAMVLDMSVLSLHRRPDGEQSALLAPRLRVDSQGARAELTARF